MHKRAQHGLTLLELMMVLSILLITSVFVIPGVGNLMTQQRIISDINRLSGLLSYARQASLSEHIRIVICPTNNATTCSDNWQLPIMVFTDANADDQVNGSDTLLQRYPPLQARNIAYVSVTPIRFYAGASSATASSLVLCDSSANPDFSRGLTVSLQGRIRLAKDSNQDGQYEDSSGTVLACS